MLRRNRPKPSGLLSELRHTFGHVWKTLVAGLLVWIPLIISVWIAWFFVNKFLFGVERQIKHGVDWLNEFGARSATFSFLQQIRYVYGVGLFLGFSLFFMTGLLTRHFVGRRIISLGERIVHFIPIVNRIYRAVQQIRDVFVHRQGAVFQKVCLIEYPRKNMIAVAFVTCSEQGLVQDVMGRELVAVFVPTTPNPTSGYLVYLPPEAITPMDITVEEAMKLIVSAGAYIPGYHTPDLEKTSPEPAVPTLERDGTAPAQ